MGVSWEEQARVQQLLTDAVMVLCKNSLKYESKFCIEGLFGITIDDSDILLVNIKESMNGALGSSAAGMSHSPAQSMVRSPAMSRMNSFRGRSPMGIGAQRMALTSPRRGRAKQITSTRGRSPQIGNRKRALFSSPLKTAHMQQQPMTLPRMSSPQHSMPMPLPDQSGLPEGPPNKMRRPSQAKVEPFNPDDVIEIGDEDEGVAHTTQSSKTETNQVKQEVPDLPSSSTDHSETKFTLDGESNKSLTDFLDNLMSQHDVGHGQSSEQMIPKTEPFDPSSSFPHLSGQASGAFGSPQHAQKGVGSLPLKVGSIAYASPRRGQGNRAGVGRGSGSVGSPQSSAAATAGDFGRRRKYHPELLTKAVQLVTEKGMSMSNAADVMGIPMTTLWRKVKAKDGSSAGRERGSSNQGQAQSVKMEDTAMPSGYFMPDFQGK